MIPATTAKVVARSRPSSPSTWIVWRNPIPALVSEDVQPASVRIRYETKNGATMRSRKKFRHAPARNAIQ